MPSRSRGGGGDADPAPCAPTRRYAGRSGRRRRSVARAKADRQAFAPLYRSYVDPIYRYCYYRLGSHEDAEDATSQVFTRALAGLAGCQDDAFRSWLFAIAHNVVTDRYRARRAHEPLADAEEMADPAASPETIAIHGADADAVLALLEKLVPDQRRVLELRLVGLTDTEIGSVLERSPGAVRSIQFRAVTRLRSLLGVPAEEADDER